MSKMPPEKSVSSSEGAMGVTSRYHVRLPPLPASWSYQQFGKVLDVQGGSQPPKSTFVYEPTPGYVQLLQIRDFGKRGVPTYVREDSVTKRCTEDDILIARYGASLGRIVTGEFGAYNVALAKVIFNQEHFFNRYLFYLLQTPFFQTPIHMISRSAQNGFNKGDLSDILLPVAPLPEQRRIVAEIEKQFSRLEEGVSALKRLQANLKRYRAAVLKAACEGKLVENEAKLALSRGQKSDVRSQKGYESGEQLLKRILDERRKNWSGRGKYKEPAVPDITNMPQLPEGWTWCMSDAVFSFITSGSRGWAQYYSEIGPIFLRIGNLDHENIRLDLDDLQHVNPPKGSEGTRTVVQPNDILISITADVGMVGLVPEGLGEAYINQHVALARLMPSICPSYIAYYLCASEGGWGHLKKLQRGATKVGLGLDDIRSVPIPLPPLAEQKRIVEEVERRLSVVEELESLVTANLQRASRLRQAVLQKAFEGKLVV